MKESNRGAFASKFGLIMALAGSAIGLGNIWRFPFLAGENGGGAFLIIYLALVALVGLPMVLSEFVIGRSSGLDAVKSFKKLAPKTKWYYTGYLAVIIGFVLLAFYSVVSGWAFRFLWESVATGFVGQSAADIKDSFHSFTASLWGPMLTGLVFVGLCALIIAQGVEKGVEKFNKILIPLLFVMLVALCINSVTLDGWGEGMRFLFLPDWSAVTFQTFLDALGQVFFTLSIGMGVMITYASYDKSKGNMVRSKVTVSILDTTVAIISGIAIFPAVFTFGLTPTEGPELVFVTLPNVFAQMPFGWPLAILFFGVLSIAAITSGISILEMLVSIFIERFDMSRRRATIVTSLMTAVLTVLCALSSDIFNFFDMLSSNLLMPLCGLLVAIFVGWFMDKKLRGSTFTTNGQYATAIYPIFVFLIRYVVPISIAFIIVSLI